MKCGLCILIAYLCIIPVIVSQPFRCVVNTKSENAWIQHINEDRRSISRNKILEISVVFHIFSFPGETPLSRKKILEQIDILNQNFGSFPKRNLSIPSYLREVVGSGSIKFCLASHNPDGFLHTGINHYISEDSLLGVRTDVNGRRSIKFQELGGVDAWSTDRFLNIWVIDRSGILGDATFPDSHGLPEDGIVIHTGAIGRSFGLHHFYNQGKTLVHEIGHYLGLLHPWGIDQSCQNDDMITDTPQQEKPYFGCPEKPMTTCGSLDQIYNFMDFSDDSCLRYFTKDQINLMQGVLSNQRSSLIAEPCSNSNTNLELSSLEINILLDNIIITNKDEEMVNLNIDIFNLLGQNVQTHKGTPQHVINLNTLNLTTGVYFLRIDNGQEYLVRKFFKWPN